MVGWLVLMGALAVGHCIADIFFPGKENALSFAILATAIAWWLMGVVDKAIEKQSKAERSFRDEDDAA